MEVTNDEQHNNLKSTSKKLSEVDSTNDVLKSNHTEKVCDNVDKYTKNLPKESNINVIKGSKIHKNKIELNHGINVKKSNNETDLNTSIRSKITFESDLSESGDEDESATLTESNHVATDVTKESNNISKVIFNEKNNVDTAILKLIDEDNNTTPETFNKTVKTTVSSTTAFDKLNVTKNTTEISNDNVTEQEKQNDNVTEQEKQNDNVTEQEKQNDNVTEQEKQNDNVTEQEKQNDNVTEQEKQNDNVTEQEKQNDNVTEKETLDDVIKIEMPIEDTIEMTSDQIKMLQLNLRPRRADKRRYADLSETNIERKLQREYKEKIRDLKCERRARSKRNNLSIVNIKEEDINDDYKPPSKSKKKTTMQIKNEGPPYFCDLCEKICTTLKGYQIHMQHHNKTKCNVFTCPMCSQTFQTNGQLIQHKTTHEEETYLCNKCEVAFSNYDDWAIHKIIHTRTNTYNCGQCQMKFSSGHRLALHIPTHTRSQEKCNICGKVIVLKYMQKHLKSHEDPSFECVECGRKFTNKKSLDYHMVSHTGLKLFQCWYCGKGFSNEQQRTTHTRYHTGEKPFKCNYCEEYFAQSTDKNRHEVKHFDSKKFECDICHRKFFEKGQIRSHMKMHVNYRPYSCVECPKRFLSLPAYKFHMNRVHLKLKEAYCDVCDKRFNDKADLTRHCKRSKSHKNKVFLKESGGIV